MDGEESTVSDQLRAKRIDADSGVNGLRMLSDYIDHACMLRIHSPLRPTGIVQQRGSFKKENKICEQKYEEHTCTNAARGDTTWAQPYNILRILPQI